MSQLKYPITIVTVSAAVFVVYVFVVGVFTFLKIPPNPCEMTYMFENPKYIPIPVNKGSTKYKLYAYGEGRYAKSLFQGRFHGIPVLFIPGNAGCFKQVRSLASVAYRMHEDLHKLHHFNYFTIDFNEEFSGLYGGVLYTQSDFVVAALKAIQQLYSEPKKVILIGHSMGGLIARSVFVHPEFQYTSVDLILTLSTPHNTAPLQFDWSIHSFYSDWWEYVKTNPKIYEDKLFVSIGSGIRDTMIQPYQTTIYEEEEMTINVLTTCIPDVHLSPDHLQMVWCRQLIKKINHALFDMIDKNTLKLMENVSIMRDIARVSFLGAQSAYTGTGKKRETNNVINVKDMLFQATVTSREGWKKFVVPAKDGYVTAIIVQNPPAERWLYHCDGDDSSCENISGEAVLYPDNFAVYTELRKGGKYEVFIHGGHGRERKSTRSMITVQHHIGGALDLTSYEKDSIKIADRAEQVLTVPTISNTDFWVVSKVTVKQTSCSLLKSTQRLPIGRMKYGTEDTFYKGSAEEVDIMVELLTVDPSETSLSSPQIQLILDPACSYSFSLQTEGFRTAANFIRYHYHLIGGLLLFVLLGLCSNLVSGSKTSLLQSLTQDRGSMFTFLFIVIVKFLLWIAPALHGTFGIDWMTLEGEILLTVLLTVHTITYTLYHLGTFFSSFLFKLVSIVRLDNCRPVFFSWNFQIVLLVLGFLTSGSCVNLLNLLFFVFFVVSRRNVHPGVHALFILLLYGIGLQLPVTLSWLKNLTLRHYWLEGDAASRVTLPISVFSCYVATTLCNGSTATRNISIESISKVVSGLNLLRFLTLTLVLTRVYLVMPFLFAALLLLTGFFILAPSKSKVS